MKSFKKVVTKRVVVSGVAVLFFGVLAPVGAQSSGLGPVPGEFHAQQDPSTLTNLANTITSSLNRDQDHVNIFISVPILANHNQNNKKKKTQNSQDQDMHDTHDTDGSDPDGCTCESSSTQSGSTSPDFDACEKLGQALTSDTSTQAFWKSIIKGNSEYKKAAQKAGALLYRASQVGGAFVLMGNIVLAHQSSKNLQSQRDGYTSGAPAATSLDTSILLMSVIQAAALPSAIALLNSAFQGCK